MRNLFILLISLLVLASCSKKHTLLNSDFFIIELDQKANISGLVNMATQNNYVPDGLKKPLLTIRKDNIDFFPTGLKFEKNILTLFYENDISAQVKVEQKDTHLTFELIEISR